MKKFFKLQEDSTLNENLRQYIEVLAVRADQYGKEGKRSESEVLWKVIAELEQLL